MLTLLLFVACGQDLSVSTSSKCDGQASSDEKTVDSPFDRDGDGFFDGSNPDCLETYGAENVDCDDTDAAVNPGETELVCTGLDEDCDEATADAEDLDADGYDTCSDCDDSIAEVHPNLTEVSCNDLDDDCDGATPDAVDLDGDGWFSCDDCNDGANVINPSVTEVLCNDLDDDCNETTPDEIDQDGDGDDNCIDCNDLDATISYSAQEVCDDGIDNNCNSEIDENCTIDYTDTWTLDDTVFYQCAEFFGYYLVTVNVSSFTIIDNNPVITVAASGTQPGTMTGAFTSSTEFNATNVLYGSCTETYAIEGEFTSETTFEGTMTAQYSGSTCLDCVNQVWYVTGSR